MSTTKKTAAKKAAKKASAPSPKPTPAEPKPPVRLRITVQGTKALGFEFAAGKELNCPREVADQLVDLGKATILGPAA
ncbi:hypothetical protein AAFN60_02065 [Roseibacillus persicicus]|uniref:hypothetical protein n=1 Tax=Roseibacillus persicicus TaxID=454148 RepID=UPI00398B3A02